MRKRPLALITLALLCVALFAQDSGAADAVPADDIEKTIAAWYRGRDAARPYEDIRAELTDIFTTASQAALPLEILIDFLNEAAARAVPSSRLTDALGKRLRDLIVLKTALDQTRDCPAPPAAADDSPAEQVTRFSQFLRRGLSGEVIAAVLRDACARKKNAHDAFEALRTIANIPSLGELPEERIITLGKAILRSSLAQASYTALSSIYIKGKLKNMDAGAVTEIIIRALEEGKGLIRIEQELNRRGVP